MRTITTEERRAHVGRRHLFSAPAASVTRAAADLTGFHSSDPATVFLSARARLEDFRHETLEHALYRDRTVLRLHGMRRTMFVVDPTFAQAMHTATTTKYLPAEVRKFARMIEEHGIADDGATHLEQLMDAAVAHLAASGPRFARDITAAVPGLDAKLTFGQGTKYQGTLGLSTKVLFLAASAGRIARGNPQGTWISSQYEWNPFRDWAGFELTPMDPATARAEILERWLATYGPGTLTDITWWSGLGKRDMQAALTAIGAQEVALDDGAVAYVGADDLDEVSAADDWVRLLPSLDQALMGWKERHWFLGDLGEELFDRNGNSGQIIMWSGRVVGGWNQLKSGRVTTELMVDVPKKVRDEVRTRARELEVWMGDIVVTPRFPSPFDKRMRAAEA